jgi:hypothetical protein
MSEIFATFYIARIGETPWCPSGRYAGLTDLPLVEGGQNNGRRVGNQLREWVFTHVFTGPPRNNLVWRYCSVIVALGLLFFRRAMMLFRQMLVQIQA